jgi:hypothetical protein
MRSPEYFENPTELAKATALDLLCEDVYLDTFALGTDDNDNINPFSGEDVQFYLEREGREDLAPIPSNKWDRKSQQKKAKSAKKKAKKDAAAAATRESALATLGYVLNDYLNDIEDRDR